MSLLRLAFPRSLNLLTKNPISTTKINDICNNAFLKSSFVNSELNKRFFSLTSKHCCQEEPVKTGKYGKPGRNRTTKIPVETSIAYVTSEAFREAYGDKLVWEGYRRVHKGNIPPKKTRASCIRFNFVTTASPCPICRDEYLILDHRNLRLLKQFISEHTGEVREFPTKESTKYLLFCHCLL